MKVISAPLEVILCVTSKCNLSCKHCAVAGTKFVKKDLTKKEWFRVIDELQELKVFEINVTGGEPFMRKDIFEILELISKRPFRFSINTNALLIDAEKARQLSGYKNLSFFTVSLDGANSQTYEKLRGRGTFDKAIKGIKTLLKETKRPVSLYSVITKYNLGEIRDIVRFARSLGASSLRLEESLPIGSALCNYKALVLNRDERQYFFKICKSLKREFGDFINQPFKHFEGLSRLIKKDVHKRGLSVCSLTSCAGSVKSVAIRSDGEVVPCERLMDYTVGNVKRRGLGDIWRNSAKLNTFRKRFTMLLTKVKECRDCRYNTICRAGCPAVSFYLNKTIFGRDIDSCYRIFQGEEKLGKLNYLYKP